MPYLLVRNGSLLGPVGDLAREILRRLPGALGIDKFECVLFLVGPDGEAVAGLAEVGLALCLIIGDPANILILCARVDHGEDVLGTDVEPGEVARRRHPALVRQRVNRQLSGKPAPLRRGQEASRVTLDQPGDLLQVIEGISLGHFLDGGAATTWW